VRSSTLIHLYLHSVKSQFICSRWRLLLTPKENKKKRKKDLVFLAVYRCASSAIPEMKGDLASVPHFAVTTPIYTRTGGATGDRETEMNENIEKRKKHNFVVSIISMASRWTIYECIADSSFIESDDP